MGMSKMGSYPTVRLMGLGRGQDEDNARSALLGFDTRPIVSQ